MCTRSLFNYSYACIHDRRVPLKLGLQSDLIRQKSIDSLLYCVSCAYVICCLKRSSLNEVRKVFLGSDKCYSRGFMMQIVIKVLLIYRKAHKNTLVNTILKRNVKKEFYL